MYVKCPFCGSLNTMKTPQGYRCLWVGCSRRFNDHDVDVRNRLKREKIQELIDSGLTVDNVADKFEVDKKLILRILTAFPIKSYRDLPIKIEEDLPPWKLV